MEDRAGIYITELKGTFFPPLLHTDLHVSFILHSSHKTLFRNETQQKNKQFAENMKMTFLSINS